jgi:dihydrodipicolinate synthase/N-acetylneuraminate lyase
MAPYWHLAGCAGYTTGLSQLVPRKSIGLWETLDRGLYREAVVQADAFAPLVAFRKKHATAMIKAGMELLGYAGGPVRKDMKVLGELERRELRGLLQEMGAFQTTSDNAG